MRGLFLFFSLLCACVGDPTPASRSPRDPASPRAEEAPPPPAGPALGAPPPSDAGAPRTHEHHHAEGA